MNKFIITLDVDWAPDFIIDEVSSLLRLKGVQSTWFITHRSPSLEKLRKQKDLFEIGLHPNFLSGSTQGSTPEEIISNLQSIAPEAVSMRTHSLVWSSHLLGMCLAGSNLKVDASIFLPQMPSIQPFEHWLGEEYLLRIPTFWADDYQWQKPEPCWDLQALINIKGLKVMCFHPIHIYLNSSDENAYLNLKKDIKDITKLKPDIAKKYIQKGKGTKTFFLDLLNHISNQDKSFCIRDVYHAWQRRKGIDKKHRVK